jgi:hypothetical protein
VDLPIAGIDVASGAALVLSAIAIGWNIWQWHLDRRSDVRVSVREGSVKPDGKELSFTVIARNHGPTAEVVETFNLVFEDVPAQNRLSHMIVPGNERRELPPRDNVSWTWTLTPEQRYRVGRRYYATVLLATGEWERSPTYTVDERLLKIAGLDEMVSPPLASGEGVES